MYGKWWHSNSLKTRIITIYNLYYVINSIKSCSIFVNIGYCLIYKHCKIYVSLIFQIFLYLKK